MATSSAMNDQFYAGVPALAEATGLSHRQVRHLIQKHKLPVFKVGRTIFARKAAVREYFAERERACIEQGR